MKGSVDMKRFDLIIVGAGPSGLSAAIEAAKRGLEVVVFDENEKPGGQLFKQIHKFFGSKEHKAKIRGFKIGEDWKSGKTDRFRYPQILHTGRDGRQKSNGTCQLKTGETCRSIIGRNASLRRRRRRKPLPHDSREKNAGRSRDMLKH